jgi:hypothetical protein
MSRFTLTRSLASASTSTQLTGGVACTMRRNFLDLSLSYTIDCRCGSLPGKFDCVTFLAYICNHKTERGSRVSLNALCKRVEGYGGA